MVSGQSIDSSKDISTGKSEDSPQLDSGAFVLFQHGVRSNAKSFHVMVDNFSKSNVVPFIDAGIVDLSRKGGQRDMS